MRCFWLVFSINSRGMVSVVRSVRRLRAIAASVLAETGSGLFWLGLYFVIVVI